jgi:hypothetical protein
MHGEALAPGGTEGARERWTEVVLAPRLRDAMVRLNSGLAPAEVEAAVGVMWSIDSGPEGAAPSNEDADVFATAASDIANRPYLYVRV